MKNLKTKSILACAVLASVLAGGFGLGMGRAEAAQFTYSIDGATVVAWNGTEDLKGTGAKLEVWGETGATSEKSIYGGYDGSQNKTTITGKTVIFNGGTVGAVYGCYSKEGSAGSSAGSSSDGNEVDINGGTVTNVYGGYGGNGAHYNVVKITGGDVTNVYGGYGLKDGFACYNTVELRGGTIEGNVYGGYAQYEQGTVQSLIHDNKVKISGGNLSGASVYGWGGGIVTTHNNNTLQIENSVTVKEIGNFNNINFVLPQTVADDTKMLTMTNAVNLTDVAVNVYLNGESPEYITLIDNVDGSFNTGKAHVYTGTADSTTETTAYTITVAGSQLVLKDSVPWYKVGSEEIWLHSREEVKSISDVNSDVTVYRGAGTDNAYKDINVGSHTLTVAGSEKVNSIQVTGNLTAGPLEIKDGKSLKVDGSADVGQVTLGTGATVIASGVFSGGNMVSVGKNNTMQALNTVALGSNTVVSGENSVAIGNNSVATVANTVSVGRPELDTGTYADGESTAINRRIVNVAAGTADTDAATYGQVKGLVSATKADDGTITLHKLGDGATTDNDIVISPSTGGGTGTGGTTYTAGNGLVLADNGTFSVSVDSSDFSFNETNKQLQLNKNGIVESGNTGIVTGGTVYTALQSYATKTELDATKDELNNEIDTTKTYTKAVINAQVEETKAKLSQRISPYITDSGLSANDSQIQNLAAGMADNDAATYGQVKGAVGALSLSLSQDNKLSLMNGQTALQTVDLSGLGGTGTGGTVDAYTKTETDTKLAEKANVADVYTKTEVDTALGNKANTADVYAKTETYSKTEVDTELAKKANSADVYTKEQTYSKTEADTTFTTKSYVDNAIEAISGGIVSPDDKKAAYGTNNEVAKEATAIGHGNKVTGQNSVAVGAGHQIAGKNSGAFGDPTYIDADNSYAIGNSNKISGENSFVLGNKVTVTSKNAVVLGNGSEDGGENTVSVGSETLQRKIVNVADGENAHDAATYGQLERTAGQLSSQIDRMGTRISKVGAGAAALAAMHPVYDPESKLTFSAGVGNYKSETAAAVGLFYRFDDRVMLNFGASVGNDNDMYNMGLNFALGRHTPKGLPTRQVMYQQLISLQTLLNEQKAENAAMHNENSTMRELLLKQSAENAAIKEQIDAQKAQHDAQIAQLLAMIEELKNR